MFTVEFNILLLPVPVLVALVQFHLLPWQLVNTLKRFQLDTVQLFIREALSFLRFLTVIARVAWLFINQAVIKTATFYIRSLQTEEMRKKVIILMPVNSISALIIYWLQLTLFISELRMMLHQR